MAYVPSPYEPLYPQPSAPSAPPAYVQAHTSPVDGGFYLIELKGVGGYISCGSQGPKVLFSKSAGPYEVWRVFLQDGKVAFQA